MKPVRLTVLVREDWRDRRALVRARCEEVGFVVESELANLGALTGSIDEDRVDTLSKVEGVASVEPERINRAL